MIATTSKLLLAAAIAATAAASAPDKGLRFDSPGVLDLAERTPAVDAAAPVASTALPDSDAGRIFAAPAISEDEPVLRFSDDEFGCAPPSRRCSLAHERERIAAAAGAVARDGKRLTVRTALGAPAVFVDWNVPATKTAEGDAETHWYLGRLPGSGYERIEVQFGHDAPGDFLINPGNGRVAFVHNGADLVAPSPDGRLLVTWNALNPPLSLRVAALDGQGPRLVVQCGAPERGERLTPVFKGWNDARGFGFVVEIGEQSKSMARLALALTRTGTDWSLQASDPARLERIGLTCRSAASQR